jgi:hypothetical protein
MSFAISAPNVSRTFDEDEDACDIWADAAREADEYIGITAAAIRDLWDGEHPAIAGDEAALVAFALRGDASTAREVARETLTAAYVGGPVKRIMSVHARRTDLDEVRQATAVGLWYGLNAFDPAKHRRPVATIQREVLAALDEVHAARFGMKVPQADRLKFAKANAVHPEDVEAAAEAAPEFGLTTEEFWHIYRVAWVADINPEAPGFLRGIASQEPVMVSLYQEDAPNVSRNALASALLDLLDARERDIVARRFGLDGHPVCTEDETAAALGLTPRRIRQIQAAALAKMRLTIVAPSETAAVYGKCCACGAVEVELNRPDGFTAIEGESDRYPTGYGCEVCD